MKTILRLFLALITLASLGMVWGQLARKGAQAIPEGHVVLTLLVGDLERECLVHLPPGYDKTKPVPLVISFHGGGGTGINAMKETGWSAKADAEGFIVAYPEGVRPDAVKPPSLRNNMQTWNDGSGRFYSAEQKIDDVAFIRVLIEKLSVNYAIDQRRIFATGFSNGASMAFRVGAELADRIAAVAPHSGACWSETVKPSRAISLCYLTGTADTLNPLDGGFPKLALGGKDQGGKPKPPVIDSILKWAKTLGCPETPVQDDTKNGVRTRGFGPGRDGAEVVFITIEGLGHNWAGGVGQAPEFMVGKNTDKLKATDVIWNFFQVHGKASSSAIDKEKP